MRIENIKIENWRSIINLDINFQELMILIGQNNHGKSNILSALLFFFGQMKQTRLDFNSSENNIKIEVIFTSLNESDKSKFKKYISSENNIRVLKIGHIDGNIEYHGYIENPTEEWLKEDKINDYIKREKAETLPLYDKLPQSGRISKDSFLQAQTLYIEEHRNDLNFTYELETTNFLGLTNVAQGIFGEVFYIPAVKNAADELAIRGKSIFGQLYSRIITKYAENSNSFKDVKSGIQNLISLLNKTTSEGEENNDRPEEFQLLEESITKEMEAWSTSIEIEVEPPDIEDIIKSGTTVWVNDGTKTDIERKGHGLQRAIIFALIKVWSKQVDSSDSDEQKPSTRKASDSSYFIIEEPELYLHPQAQKELYSSLINISQNEAQVIFSTHSSSFLDIEKYKSIAIVYKENLEIGTKLLQCYEELFQDVDNRKKFNLIYWINPDRGELFFAKKVILLEGQTDKSVIPLLAKNMNIFRFDYTLIDCGSKDTIPQYINLLNKFKLKYVVVYDKDHQSTKDDDGLASADKSSRKIEEIIDGVLGYSVVLENDIEEEIGMTEKISNNKAYRAINFVNNDSFNLTESFGEKIKKIFE